MKKCGCVTRQGERKRRSSRAFNYQFDVVDHPIRNVRLAHERRYVQSAQAEQGGVEKKLRQLARPQHPAVADQQRHSFVVIIVAVAAIIPSNPKKHTKRKQNNARCTTLGKHTARGRKAVRFAVSSRM